MSEPNDTSITDLPQHVGAPDAGDLLILEHDPGGEGQETQSIPVSALSGGSTDVGATIHAATNKITPVNADELGLWDSITGLLNKLTWANLKATLKTYFDALYLAITNKASAAEVTTGTDDTKYTTAKAIKDAGIVVTPVKASAAEITTGTDDAKFATAKAIKDAGIVVTPVKASAAEALTGSNDEKFLTPLAAQGLPSIHPDSTPDSNLKAHGIIATFNANEDQVFGDVCYIDADGQAHIAKADVIATAKVVAMAVATISANADGNYLLPGGIARNDAWNWTPGGFVYLTVTGTSTNTLSQTAPTTTDSCTVIIGMATHADRMIFFPQLVIVEHT